MHRQLSIHALSNADGKDIVKQLEDWEKDAG
jgi:hypothetical protein